jgi:hypothetical protein
MILRIKSDCSRKHINRLVIVIQTQCVFYAVLT